VGGKGGHCVGLTTLPPSCADCLEIWEPQHPKTLRVCAGIALPLPYKTCSYITLQSHNTTNGIKSNVANRNIRETLRILEFQRSNPSYLCYFPFVSVGEIRDMQHTSSDDRFLPDTFQSIHVTIRRHIVELLMT